MTTQLLRTYLVPATITLFKVCCRVEGFLCRFSPTTLHPLPAIQPIALHATDNESGPIRFDSDSFAVGVDNHGMINSPHLFENNTHGEHTAGQRNKHRVSYQGQGDIQVLHY